MAASRLAASRHQVRFLTIHVNNLGIRTSKVFGGTNQADVDAFHARVRADRIHKNRSNGQKVRQARERLYGKQSHLVTVTRIPGWEPKA